MESRDDNGRFQEGQSGNPGGRPKGFGSLIRDHTGEGEELVLFMLRVFRGQVRGLKAKDRIHAASWLADRAFGKPPLPMSENVGGPLKHPAPVFDVELTDDQVDALIAPDPQIRGIVIDQEGNSISPNGQG